MSSKLAKIVADFRTSLATKIAVGGTSATLQSITDDDLVVLPNGTYFFTLDGDSSKKEHIVCTLTGTALTNIKSVSRQGVQTVGVVREHRVGASVVITDFAHIRYLNDLLDKTTALDGSSPFKYDAEPTFVYGQHELVTWDKSKDYTDSVAVAGAPNLDENTKGIAEGATVSEQANGTDLGATGAHLILMSKNAKASSAGVADANKAVIAGADGLIDQTFLDKARTWSQVQTFTADSAQITTDPNSGNDPVRKSYADSNYNTINPFSAGSDGDVTINAPTTLSRDMYYNNLTLTGANDVNTGGYKVFVKGTLTRQAASTAKFTNNGGVGGDGQNGIVAGNAAAGTAGTGAPGITLPSGLDGKAGAAGQFLDTGGAANQAGAAGVAGSALSPALNSNNGSAGGAGGSASTPGGGTGNAGAGGAAGTTTQTKSLPKYLVQAFELTEKGGSTISILRPSASCGGGGSGGCSTQGGALGRVSSGGGGGSGGDGGLVWLAAKDIVDSGAGTMFQSKGGNGGNAGQVNALSNGAVGGSGGGAGGNGGTIVRIYRTLTGAGGAGTDVTGGSGGNGSNGSNLVGGGSANNGASGNAGNAGVVFDVVI